MKLSELKNQLRIDQDDDSMDDTLIPLITAAREYCEDFQNRTYVQQTLEGSLSKWPCEEGFKLPRPPLKSITSFIYTDDQGDTTTWDSSNYVMDDYREPGRLVKHESVSWPSVCLAPANGIKIRFVAGSDPIVGEVIDGESLGDGDGTEQIFQTDLYPIDPEGIVLYFDDVPTESYTIDVDSGAVTCTAANGVAVTIDYTKATDYGANVPTKVKQAIILLAKYWFDNPECDPPSAVNSLLWQNRV